MPKRTFEKWFEEANVACLEKCGMSLEDLPDCPFYDWYEDGKSPKVAANKAIKMIDD